MPTGAKAKNAYGAPKITVNRLFAETHLWDGHPTVAQFANQGLGPMQMSMSNPKILENGFEENEICTSIQSLYHSRFVEISSEISTISGLQIFANY